MVGFRSPCWNVNVTDEIQGMSCDSNRDDTADQRKYSEWNIRETIIIASAKLGCDVQSNYKLSERL